MKYWGICSTCQGTGRVLRKPTNRRVREYKTALAAYEADPENVTKPQLARNPDRCVGCSGSGLVRSESAPKVDKERYPNVAIIGGGIGGSALAVACMHRSIPHTLYERDTHLTERAQGYGLTLQQASKAVEALGISLLSEGITSTKHVVHDPSGRVVGEWGLRKWNITPLAETQQRKNIHIPRQTLRKAIIDQLDPTSIKWDHKLTDLKENTTGTIDLTFETDAKTISESADLVVGADGIRSKVRELLIGEAKTPLQYLGCIVILGICPLEALRKTGSKSKSELLDGLTVFQTANGNERIYVMPYDTKHIMWQLSFPLKELDAIELSKQGAAAMKEEAQKRLRDWHDPIGEMLAATKAEYITGYPAYDREVLDPALLKNTGNATLIGDAAHPMSPFKGQGANQALLDALLLARTISATCTPYTNWREMGLRTAVLEPFEAAMTARANPKVRDSRKAAEILHSPEVLRECDSPRG